jgi:PIN domain nuclease of toxin-antitoxin system
MIILDTHIWYWWINLEHHNLSKTVLTKIEQSNEIAISTASCLEITWLVNKRCLILPCPLSNWFSYSYD